MQKTSKHPEPHHLSSWKDLTEILSNYIKQKASSGVDLEILEAGCGTKWGLDLRDVQYTLTGVDIDSDALNIRKSQSGDLEVAILGDLRTVDLQENWYDVIYNAFVLEHVAGAEYVLKNFMRWLKPGGILILFIPDRDSAKGFLTRILPFWLHVFYKKYIQGVKNAGKPGFDPFPTFFDKVVSRNGIYEFCEQHDLVIRKEYSYKLKATNYQILDFLSNLLLVIIHLVSFGRLSVKYGDLIYIIEKR
jgi:SAM-dependent methyltransferase